MSLDGSDLIEKMQWAQEHDDAAEEIAIEARHFADEYLTDQAAYGYIHTLLTQYAQKLLEITS